MIYCQYDHLHRRYFYDQCYSLMMILIMMEMVIDGHCHDHFLCLYLYLFPFLFLSLFLFPFLFLVSCYYIPDYYMLLLLYFNKFIIIITISINGMLARFVMLNAIVYIYCCCFATFDQYNNEEKLYILVNKN